MVHQEFQKEWQEQNKECAEPYTEKTVGDEWWTGHWGLLVTGEQS